MLGYELSNPKPLTTNKQYFNGTSEQIEDSNRRAKQRQQEMQDFLKSQDEQFQKEQRENRQESSQVVQVTGYYFDYNNTAHQISLKVRIKESYGRTSLTLVGYRDGSDSWYSTNSSVYYDSKNEVFLHLQDHVMYISIFNNT